MEDQHSKESLFQLFVSFIKIGLFTFGGGYAMLPMLEKETVEKHGWITNSELLDIFSISQVTPGPIAINSATYIGYKIRGFWGSLVCTLGVALPSFVIILLIAGLLYRFISNEWVAYAFEGIRICIVFLMILSVIKLAKADKKSPFYFIVLGISFVVATFTEFNIILLLLIMLAAGIIYRVICRRKDNGV